METQAPTPTNAPRIGEWLSEMFNLYQREWKTWAGQGALFLLVGNGPALAGLAWYYVALFSALPALQNAGTTPPGSPPPPGVVAALIAALGGLLGGSFLSVFLAIFFMAGMTRSAARQLRGEPISVADVFSGGDVYFPALGGYLLVTVACLAAMPFCYLPALLLAALWMYVHPLIVERRLGVFEAMRTSWNAALPHMWLHVLWLFLLGILASLGVYLCGIGMAFTWPFYSLGLMIAYRDTIGLPGALPSLRTNAGAPPAAGAATYLGDPGASTWASGYPVQPPPAPPAPPPPPVAGPDPEPPSGSES